MSRERVAPAPIRHEVTVDVPPADAFAAFSEGMNAWWPRSFTWSGQALERIAIEPRHGGFAHEIGPGGMRLDWGRVVAWEPPHRLAFSWQVGPDRVPEVSPANASHVEVRFEPAGGGGTLVSLVHDGWERHGEGGAAYRDEFDAARAWPRILEAYAAAVVPRDEAPWSGLST
ncbi:MAG TPA: SRPBCC family protein [Candidatus Limnocylindria bacterium]|jgi:uncharacterized protein YndB with AHSA1/START domain